MGAFGPPISQKERATMSVEAYPLYWPEGVKRTPSPERSRFKTGFGAARNYLFDEIRRMGGTNIILSSNVPLRNDGMPRANMPEPRDAGIAVYFKRRGKDLVFSCDKFHYTRENIYALGKTIEALRGIERWGGTEVMDRAFSGFKALTATSEENWWDILECRPDATTDIIQEQYKSRVRAAHPDSGGSVVAMQRLNMARDRALAERGGL
jgi:hypothetical protein